MLTIAGTISKNPWTGPAGVFGNGDKWDTANQELWAYLEWFPQWAVSPSGAETLLPGPDRNPRIAEVDASLKMCAFFSDVIQSSTGMLDPSRQLASSDNPAKKVEQLQQQGQLGSLQYIGNLKKTIGSMYAEMLVIFPQIYDSAQVKTIVKADGETEDATINQEFGDPHPETGRRKIHDIKRSFGKYSVRAEAGPDYESRRDAASERLTEFFKVAPGALQSPAMMGSFLRLIGDGNPIISQMADILDPPVSQGLSPKALAGQVASLTQQNKAMSAVIQALNFKLEAGLPEIEKDKWEKALDSLTKIRVAEINASKDLDKAGGDRLAAQQEQVLSMAHETAMDAVGRQHEAAMAQQAQQAAAQQQDQQGEQGGQ
jgi:hypothetical protein